MRPRLAILLAVVVTGTTFLVDAAYARDADARGPVLAQQGDDLTGQEDEAEGQEGQGGEGEGQGDPGAETGAGGETEGGASTEAGPPWTYQMARISLALLVPLAAGIALTYYRLVARRQRGEV